MERPRAGKLGLGVWALVVALAALAVLTFLPSPYVIQRPGPVYDTLGTAKNADGEQVPLISVDGTETYETGGTLDLTTVQVVGNRERTPSWFELALAWMDASRAVVPLDAVFPEGVTTEQRDERNAMLMVDSQHEATAAALNELGYDTGAEVVVVDAVEGSPADGLLQADDVITAIDGTPAWRFIDLQEVIRAGNGAPVALDIWRPSRDGTEGESFSVTLVPRRTDLPVGDGTFETRFLIGATGSYMFEPVTEPVGLLESVTSGVSQTWGIITQSISGIRAMIAQQISSCNLTGALRIAETSAAAAKSGPVDFIWFIAVLSTAVGFLNLFPIPVLDGGHLMFHLYEAIVGKPPSDRLMNAFMSVGLALVLTLMLFGLWNDLTC